MEPGASGEFPDGKIAPDDLGELTIAISEFEGRVRFDFGKATNWFAVTPDDAIGLAFLIVAKARKMLDAQEAI